LNQFEQAKQHLLEQQYTWVVTGVAGFIGSHLLEFLLAHQQKVIGIDNFVTGFEQNIADVLGLFSVEQRKLFTFIKGSVIDLETCHKLVQHSDFVLHQAALGSVPRSIKDPLVTHEANVTGFLNMLVAAKDARIKRFVYASSSSVYGDSPILPKSEGHQGNPLSPYAVSKMTNELYAKAFSNCYAIDTIGLRYFNVFGARQNFRGAYAAVIPLWIKALLEGAPIYINGDGNSSRDFCYVKNVVQANILAALSHNSKAVNTVYNVAVGEQTSLNQLYQILKELLNIKDHQPIYRDFREGDVRHSLADIEKAKNLLGYAPLYNVRQGLEKALSWYQHHEQ
jgi:UDP-N-acetylglucosamine 4-epimerase